MVFDDAELLSFLMLDVFEALDGDLLSRSKESYLFIFFELLDYLLEYC